MATTTSIIKLLPTLSLYNSVYPNLVYDYHIKRRDVGGRKFISLLEEEFIMIMFCYPKQKVAGLFFSSPTCSYCTSAYSSESYLPMNELIYRVWLLLLGFMYGDE